MAGRHAGHRREPVATYRLQLTPAFGFDAATDLLGYISRLGASHLYLSPIAQAVPGSTHGYDVVDHTKVRAELGAEEAFERLLEAAAARGMFVVIDHVPNHASAALPQLNPRWWALLRDGRTSHAATWFDVDWELTGGKVVLPILGAPLDELVATGEIVVGADGDAIAVYGERRLPVAPGTGDGRLIDVLDRQHYVLQHWRDPRRNVRRFFTIDDLVAVRVEDPDVAAEVDTLPVRFRDHPAFAGVRVDHVDGLADPAGYLRGLRERLGSEHLIYVEKILAPGERLCADWPVDGTTGYEFIRAVDHVLLDASARPVLDALWEAAARGEPEGGQAFHSIELAARREVVAGALAPDFARLTRLASVALADAGETTDELLRLTTELERYRTYLPGDPDAADLVGAISTGPVAGALVAPSDQRQVELTTRWQQLTGPVTAKGVEDRGFYRYCRLASLCEVGGDPGRFGASVAAFHTENATRPPRSLVAGSTHDTKRSDDVRARSTTLTWLAGEWAGVVERASADLGRATGLDGVVISLALQTAATAPGLDRARFEAYLVKACREAGVRTSWEEPDDDYERRLADLAGRVLAADHSDLLDVDLLAPGVTLAATALRLTVPGVPDVYQGTEAFSYRLVDPDNRVPPDWSSLARCLDDDRTVADRWAASDPGVKNELVRVLLDLRRRNPGAFGAGGAYTPIDAGDGAIAFARGDRVVVVARRGLAEVRTRLTLPVGRWYDVLDPGAPSLSGTVDASSLVGSGTESTLPVAVLERDD